MRRSLAAPLLLYRNRSSGAFHYYDAGSSDPLRKSFECFGYVLRFALRTHQCFAEDVRVEGWKARGKIRLCRFECTAGKHQDAVALSRASLTIRPAIRAFSWRSTIFRLNGGSKAPHIWPVFHIVAELSVLKWCPGAESNHRHEDFQSTALPLSYPGTGMDGSIR